MISRPRTPILLAITLIVIGTNASALDVNRASLAELERLKGLGPRFASQILAERNRSAFQDWADMLRRVRGLGTHRAERLRQDGLTVGPPSESR
jgi:competence protein ComEA